jgi:hypothetical protein
MSVKSVALLKKNQFNELWLIDYCFNVQRVHSMWSFSVEANLWLKVFNRLFICYNVLSLEVQLTSGEGKDTFVPVSSHQLSSGEGKDTFVSVSSHQLSSAEGKEIWINHLSRYKHLPTFSTVDIHEEFWRITKNIQDVQYLHLFWIFLYWLNHRRLRNSFVLGYYSFGLILVTIFEIPPNLSTTVIFPYTSRATLKKNVSHFTSLTLWTLAFTFI